MNESDEPIDPGAYILHLRIEELTKDLDAARARVAQLEAENCTMRSLLEQVAAADEEGNLRLFEEEFDRIVDEIALFLGVERDE